tara:strand:+ start:2817 stop:3011 length:195 start_codon:yes stop_codon:yes gene_type:complete
MIDTDKYGEVIDDDGYFCEDKIADLLAEVKRLNAYIESIFDGGNLDIESYEEYKDRLEDDENAD